MLKIFNEHVCTICFCGACDNAFYGPWVAHRVGDFNFKITRCNCCGPECEATWSAIAPCVTAADVSNLTPFNQDPGPLSTVSYFACA
jgi:hypothetical protein